MLLIFFIIKYNIFIINLISRSHYEKIIQFNSLGILENSEIKIYKKAPFGDPIVIKINNSTIALRKKIFKNIIMDKL